MRKASFIAIFLVIITIAISAIVFTSDAQAEMSRDLNFHYGDNLVEIQALINDLEASAIANLNDLPATLEIDPTSGPRGTTVTVSGEGWPIGNFVTISYELLGMPGKTDVAIVQPNGDGEIFAQFGIPPFAMGADELGLLVMASDGTGPESNQSLECAFTVEVPHIEVEPDHATVGDQVTVKGTGFMPNFQVNEVSISRKSIVPVLDLPVTSGTGSFKVTGTVPQLPPGGHVVMARVTQAYNEPITTPFTVYPKLIYVNSLASGANNGTNWADAYTNLQQALSNTGTPCNIWVASGTYTPVRPGSAGQQTDSFAMKNGVGIYGGFPNTGNPSWEDRNWRIHRTVLSGEIGDPATNTDNCQHVFYHGHELNLNNSAILDGFTITGGYADGEEIHHNGAGMYNSSCSPTITNCIFTDNYATGDGCFGGAMVNKSDQRDCRPVITNCTFSDNYAFGDSSVAGAMINMSINKICRPVITNCIFGNNSSTYKGGGVVNASFPGSCVPVITNCVFYGNTTNEYGGAMVNSNDGAVCRPEITNCVFWNNGAGKSHPDIHDQYTPNPVVTYCDIQQGYGGTGNIKLDPLFADPAGGDFHLLSDSPCINAGDNSAPELPGKDFEGDLRSIYCTPDMGVDEYYSLWFYDDNENDRIDYNEMVNALMDYLSDCLGYSRMVEALMEYLTG